MFVVNGPGFTSFSIFFKESCSLYFCFPLLLPPPPINFLEKKLFSQI